MKMLRIVPVVVLAGVVAACQEAQPLIESLQTSNASAAYDIATDAGRPLSDRRPAAMMVESFEQSKLKAFLMKRIPGGWYTSAANDAYVLAAIGDEGHALYLESLYDRLPDKREDARSMAVMVHTAVAMIRNRLGTQGVETAGDGLASLEQREKAVTRLDPMERLKLQGMLLDRIPGKWDENTGHDIALLGEIGDGAAAARLEGIYQKPDYTDTSSLTSALIDAVRQIRQRLAMG